MNKYLELAHKVLAESESMLTAGQIWYFAIRRGYVSEGVFGTQPWLAMGRALSREIHQHEHPSAFAAVRGTQTLYYLVKISLLWGKLEAQADLVESDLQDVLLARIRSRDPLPRARTIAVSVYDRDPDVIAYVRKRAHHHCEMCGDSSFLKDNGRPYVEVHHLRRLADGGADVPENAVALCANCHRKLHLSNDRDALLAKMVAELTAKGVDVKPQ